MACVPGLVWEMSTTRAIDGGVAALAALLLMVYLQSKCNIGGYTVKSIKKYLAIVGHAIMRAIVWFGHGVILLGNVETGADAVTKPSDPAGFIPDEVGPAWDDWKHWAAVMAECAPKDESADSFPWDYPDVAVKESESAQWFVPLKDGTVSRFGNSQMVGRVNPQVPSVGEWQRYMSAIDPRWAWEQQRSSFMPDTLTQATQTLVSLADTAGFTSGV